MKLENAKTKQDIIALLHSKLIDLIPTVQLDRIVQAILTKLLIGRQQALRDPSDVHVNYTYNLSADQITRIEIDDVDYDISK